MVIHACNQIILGVKAERAKVQDPPQLFIEFEVSLGYMRPNLREKKNVSLQFITYRQKKKRGLISSC